MIGGIPMGYDSGFDGGSGDHFILEADEYDTAYFDKRPKFVHYRPRIGILTSVEFDHADIYDDFDAVRRSFRTYAGLFPDGASLWVHASDQEAMTAAQSGYAQIQRYDVVGDVKEGIAQGLQAFASDLKLACGDEPTRFRFWYHGDDLGEFSLLHPGRHNVWNAVAALSVAMSEGIPTEQLRRDLATFQGVRRRQELLGEPRGIRIIQDYAHHPTAVRETLAALRAQYPDRRLWALFEAESNTSRRNIFQDAYAAAFGTADEVVFVKPLEKDDNLAVGDRLDAKKLVDDLRANGVRARFIPEADQIMNTLLTETRQGDVVLFMSGRNFLGLPARLVEALA
jgi:UDP-N-acetylmuramate: L-alanyl-gamma-D-glutamyl-meso-diaminopimelate ligase